jgi:hypothetical protein
LGEPAGFAIYLTPRCAPTYAKLDALLRLTPIMRRGQAQASDTGAPSPATNNAPLRNSAQLLGSPNTMPRLMSAARD